MFIDVNNLPEYMKECITEDFNDAGLLIHKETGSIVWIDDMLKSIKKEDINIENLKNKYIMISAKF